MSEAFFRFVVSYPFSVEMVGDFMNQNIIQIKPPQVIQGVTGWQTERVGEKKNARIPIHSVASKFAAPRLLLLARPTEQENRSQVFS